MTTVVATPGQGPDRPQEVSYTDIKVSKNVKPEPTSVIIRSSFLVCRSALVFSNRGFYHYEAQNEVVINDSGSSITVPGAGICDFHCRLYNLLSGSYLVHL